MKKYAESVIKTGINLQKGQVAVIRADIAAAEFVRALTKAAYENGAKEVVVNWADEQITKMWYDYSDEEIFENVHEWMRIRDMYNLERGAAFISVTGTDPDLLKDSPVENVKRYRKAIDIAMKKFQERLMGNYNRWCVVAIPTESWAKKVFPNSENAMEQLWDAIIKASRADDSTESWEQYAPVFKKRIDFLQSNNFKKLTFKNSVGTDVVVELPENHIWGGGGDIAKDGLPFMPNIPTEEIFTVPKKTGVNGKIVNTMPLVYAGITIENMWLKLENGKIVDYGADAGYEALKSIIETDDGAKYLGEVALVPVASPISEMQILFYNTLYDENASCHFAIGNAYVDCVKGGAEMSEEQLEQAGINKSMVHIDFMFGSADMHVVGETKDGKQIDVMINGNFAF